MDKDLVLSRIWAAAYAGEDVEKSDFKLPISFTEPSSYQEIKQQAERDHLLPSNIPSHQWLDKSQEFFDRDRDYSTLLLAEPSPASIALEMTRRDVRGDIGGYRERSLRAATTSATSAVLTSKNSTSFSRAPGKRSEFVRGKAGFFPFTPGGLDKEELKNPSALEKEKEELGLEEVDLVHTLEKELSIGSDERLLTVPPGFQRGMFTEEDSAEALQAANGGAGRSIFSIEEMLNDEGINGDDQALLEPAVNPLRPKPVEHEEPSQHEENHEAEATSTTETAPTSSEEPAQAIDSLLPTAAPKLPVPKRPVAGAGTKREWAHVIDVNLPFDDFYEKVPEMAHQFPFELDTFQKRAVYHLEKGESVFVAAHTSAGKTVVAEYAIALAARHMTKAIYTSPIKALSNQKFRDFKGTFDEVGLLTGDVQINPEASCLIMTTEILRSMLYRGADLIRDVEFVIFDEVHYVNDFERGVVWEEVIIMLPAHVTLILLSATVPNTKEFADWVGRTKKKDIYVISTPKRPVPLEHHLYANKDVYKIVDAKGSWLQLGYKDASDAMRKKDKDIKAPAQRGGFAPRGGSRAGGWRNDKQDKNLFTHLVGYLNKRKCLPVVIFTFSKKKCEENASGLSSTDLMSSSEKSEVHVFIERSLVRLRGSDRDLPQVHRMRDLLSRGIAVHHSGLLPIIKEMVEILFARGLVKVLFATETFAMGVNMPARTVVFSGIRKHDGTNFRELLPGEYTQMSGRAGRRGLDATGLVIIAFAGDEPPGEIVLKEMILGKPTKLKSQFRLTYNMILNLLRVEALRVEEMIKRSFSENSAQKALPEKQELFIQNAKSIEQMPKLDCTICNGDIEEFYNQSSKVLTINSKLMELIVHSAFGSKALSSGRIVVLNSTFHRNTLAVVIKPVNQQTTQDKSYWCLILQKSQEGTTESTEEKTTPLPIMRLKTPDSAMCTQVVEPISYKEISTITNSAIRINETAILEMNDTREMARVRQELLRYAAEVEDSQTGLVKEYDWSKIKTLEFQEALRERMRLVERILTFQCNKCPDLNAHYGIIHNERVLRLKLEELKHTISDQNLELLPDYHQRVNVLKELRYLDPESSTVQLKGRVACEINTADELILTELIFDNMLADFEPEEIVALLSCFVFQEKNASEPSLTSKLSQGRDMILALEQRMAEVQHAHGLTSATAPGESALKFALVEAVYEWAKGMTFKQITELTDVQEGSIVRTIHRLDETCNEVKSAARMIGDASLYTKMDVASQAIKRDIVFAASLRGCYRAGVTDALFYNDSLGTFEHEVNRRPAIKDAVKKALEVGYRHIDTAWYYETEQYVGEGIREAKVPRREIFVTTKLWNSFHKPEDVRPALEDSLKNLGLEYVDLYLLHFPIAFDPKDDPFTTSPKAVDIDYLETWRAMEDLLTTDKVKALGVSNFSQPQLERLLQHCRQPPQVLQTEIHPQLPENELIEFCKRNQIHVTAFAPLGSFRSQLLDNPTIIKVAQKHNIEPAAVLLSWGLQRGTSVIPKSALPKHIEVNLRDIVHLDKDDIHMINSINKDGENTRRYWDMEATWGINIFGYKV
ncbi:hypothetical protein BGW42_002433 [Actinomortierella wolfii]|nr:hypothetical protein BGW42_002433 [Actinomortierella wolfii]